MASSSEFFRFMQADLGCTGYTGKGTRYFKSLLCAKATDAGRSRCPLPISSLPKRVCADVCEAMLVSFNELLLQNKLTCPVGVGGNGFDVELRSKRQGFIFSLNAVCNTTIGVGIGSTPDTCIGPTNSESETCGKIVVVVSLNTSTKTSHTHTLQCI